MKSTQSTILIVDDDPKIRTLLRRCLELEGYNILEAENASEVKNCFAKHHIDLVTLDLNLGADNGLSIATELKSTHDVAILIITGKGEVIDRVVGLEVGADDYISKPFHVREVLARIRSVLRRTKSPSRAVMNDHTVCDATFAFEGWTAIPSRLELKDSSGVISDLTSSDFKLLMVFLERPKRVLSREQLMDYIGGIEWTPLDRTIDNQVARLRKKIEPDPANPMIIKTVRGIGYMFASDVLQS
ncbi:response regulator [Amylibacter sp. SFDW26]|uniref:response regulator n=1 Tax=Amylibacter sp. SFDW26 TaxID=2652722 RepID=UPI0012624B3C|nr:response regulator [Amylibacter sp. SFDW26]KAB7614438.1 response regulator [Amylibacter sp. SFDW26]